MLLARLGLPFAVAEPNFDESIHAGLPPYARALANARGKAAAVAQHHPEAWVIGADQVGVCDGRVLQKPGDANTALAMLLAMRGQSACFHTACVLMTPEGMREAVVDTVVQLRDDLTEEEIRAYLAHERPWDCAGAFRIEALGIALMARVQGPDPTALEGLPLITLARWLQPLARLSQTSSTSGQGVFSPGASRSDEVQA